jgi:hypothetical protein
MSRAQVRSLLVSSFFKRKNFFLDFDLFLKASAAACAQCAQAEILVKLELTGAHLKLPLLWIVRTRCILRPVRLFQRIFRALRLSSAWLAAFILGAAEFRGVIRGK